MVGGAAHRDGELQLPVLRPGPDEQFAQLAQLRDDARADLRVDARRDAVGAQQTERLERRVERSLDAAQFVVERSRAVDRTPAPLSPASRPPNPLFGQCRPPTASCRLPWR